MGNGVQIAESILQYIGNTPMIRLTRLPSATDAEILAKLESFNPGGSVKDRIAAYMVEVAERQGKLRPGGTIIEATSGNTGIGLAMVAAAKGYRLILVMPETMSVERKNLLRAYGAELYLTPGPEGMQGSIELAEQMLREHPDYFMPRQFDNPANPEIHRLTTAQEILEQTGGRLDAFVAGIGTGGTITGVGEVLKEQLSHVRIIGVEPEASAVLSGRPPGPHKIQGIGAGFIPKVLNRDILDEIVTVTDVDAYLTSLELAEKEGILVGISAGAAVFAALQIAKRLGKGKRVVTLLPDTGERYLSLKPYFKLDLRKRGIKC
ncbi:cysteine synthase A [Calderihabitans maritimus]|uniref:Cysteine synthase n=1 Tax=Calderihabitans maritimus TaxID=1246530 RepID=A0A1Z5HW39_9FIRM|nr:cysteine synthase A [Calderihabitans maritimus]GAW93749.1 cysteine synthase A [Calderihabitans maritimus]